jgi:hypothetical protein
MINPQPNNFRKILSEWTIYSDNIAKVHAGSYCGGTYPMIIKQNNSHYFKVPA